METEEEISKIATAHEATAIEDRDLGTEIADRDHENAIEGPDHVIGGRDQETEIGTGEIEGVARVTDVGIEEDRGLGIDVRQGIETDHAIGQPETTKKNQGITPRGRTKNAESPLVGLRLRRNSRIQALLLKNPLVDSGGILSVSSSR